MKEMLIHRWFLKKMKEKFTLVHIKPSGNEYAGRKGVSDFLFCINGRFIAVEIKSEKGKLTALQNLFLDEVAQAGGISMVLYGKDESIFDKLKHEIY